MPAQPLFEHIFSKRFVLELPVDEPNYIFLIAFEPPPVEAEEDVHAGKRDALIAVDEAMVHRQAFPKCSRFLNCVGIVAGLRPQKRRLDQPQVANSLRATEQSKLLAMNEKSVIQAKINHGYLASAS